MTRLEFKAFVERADSDGAWRISHSEWLKALHYAAEIVEFVETLAACPCCDGADTCEADCTYMHDCPEDHDRMLTARTLLKGW